MTANLSLTDRPVSEFSPSFRPSYGNLNERYQRVERRPSHSTSQSSPPLSPYEDPPHNVFVPPPPTTLPPAVPSARPPPRPTQGRDPVASAQASIVHRATGSIGWDPGLDISALDADTSRNHGLPRVGEGLESQGIPRTWEEQQAWERRERQLRIEQVAAAAKHAELAEMERKAEEEWHRGEATLYRSEIIAPDVTAQSGVYGQLQSLERSGSTRRLRETSQDPETTPLQREGPVSDSLPWTTQESREPPVKKSPAFPQPDIAAHTSGVETPQSKTKRQRSETYQIKQVCWYDVSAVTNPRRSPILIQNANGPCPLLALVNALVLSTPADTTTALVETLRVREQVSLGLLLDAVFDELMSGRRGGAAQELPDVGDLYSFLITLHTGMNVNPRFVALPPNISNNMDASASSHLVIVRDDRQPGTFEETREMRLYSTFNIPLIHGWLASSTQPAYQALQRSAQTYEDAQNLLFREEELEEQLKRIGFSSDEQILLEDIASIRHFLSSSATQLTQFGLEIITEAMHPGSVAILFRNDHFSTLYKHPRSNKLLTLVTDMGYAGHDEVVWESLVDVSGEGSEFFAGDFRPVGNVASEAHSQEINNAADEDGWTTVHRNTNPTPNSTGNPLRSSSNLDAPLDQTTVLPSAPATEQEDHDLALALQLQEEEEDRHRRETAARRREDELSQAFLNSEEPSNQRGRGRGRGRGQGHGQEIRPLVPPRGTPRPNINSSSRGGNEDGPPPSYEQAARGPAYYPPPNHPAHPHALPGGGGGGGGGGARPAQAPPRRQLSAYSQTAALHGGGEMSTHHRPGQRRSTGARGSGVNVGGVGGPGAVGLGIPRRRSAGGLGTPLELEAAGRKDKDCVVM